MRGRVREASDVLNRARDAWRNLATSTRIYAGCFLVAASVAGFASLAFMLSGRLVGSAPAQANNTEARHNLTRRDWTDHRFSQAPQGDRLSGPGAGGIPASVQPVKRQRERVASRYGSLPPEPLRIVASLAESGTSTAGTAPIEIDLSEAARDTDDTASRERWLPRPGTIRTVCVRLCDGAYVPVSFATTPDRLAADSARCEASCSAPSRLFTGPPDGAPESMTDLSGTPYSALPTAFRFRTIYDQTCACNGPRHGPASAAIVSRETTDLSQDDERAAQHGPLRAIGQPTIDQLDIATLRLTQRTKARTSRPAGLAPLDHRIPDLVTGSNLRQAGGSVAELRILEPAPGTGQTPAEATRQKPKSAAARGARKATQGAAKAPQTSDGMQRPFRSSEYWRLSYWEPSF